MPASGSSCRIQKSHALGKGRNLYQYDCGEGLLPSNDIFGNSFIEEKAQVDRGFPLAPHLGNLSAGNEEIKYKDLYPEP